MSNTTNAAGQIISRIGWFVFMAGPLLISLFLAYQVREMARHTHGNELNQIVCFSDSMCAIQVNGIWYHIDGVIDMSETIPEEYLSTLDFTQDSQTPVTE